jgi:hypothetical protein
MTAKAGWLLVNEIVPRLRSAIPQVAHCVGAEDAEELVQDGTAMAARLLIRSGRGGKKVTAGNIAYYTIQHVRAGRRFHKFSKVDVMAAGTQIDGRTRLSSLEEVVASDAETGGEIFLFHDVLSRDEEDPSTRAARRLDWAEFYAGLPDREKAAVEFLLEGKTLREAGKALGFSDSSMQQSKRALAGKILEFMGPDILTQVRRLPQWRNGLDATREKQACRHERCAA